MAGIRDIEALYAEIRDGSRSALGRGLTLVESSNPADDDDRVRLLTLAAADTHGDTSTDRIAVTGVPGSGKSTLIDRLGRVLIESGRRVAVLAVDPSSDRTGGSILGDKTRMETLAADARAFVRPSPTRGHSGGVASTTRESILLSEAAGYDAVIIETVGVGQSETGVAAVADVVLLVLLAGAGDGLQGIKRGILEIADLIAVNKADGKNVHQAVRSAAELRQAMHILRPGADHPRFVRAVSALDQSDISGLADDVTNILSVRRKDGSLADTRAVQRVDWFESCVDDALRGRLRAYPGYGSAHRRLADAVRAGSVDPAHAARQLVSELLAGPEE